MKTLKSIFYLTLIAGVALMQTVKADPDLLREIVQKEQALSDIREQLESSKKIYTREGVVYPLSLSVFAPIYPMAGLSTVNSVLALSKSRAEGKSWVQTIKNSKGKLLLNGALLATLGLFWSLESNKEDTVYLSEAERNELLSKAKALKEELAQARQKLTPETLREFEELKKEATVPSQVVAIDEMPSHVLKDQIQQTQKALTHLKHELATSKRVIKDDSAWYQLTSGDILKWSLTIPAGLFTAAALYPLKGHMPNELQAVATQTKNATLNLLGFNFKNFKANLFQNIDPAKPFFEKEAVNWKHVGKNTALALASFGAFFAFKAFQEPTKETIELSEREKLLLDRKVLELEAQLQTMSIVLEEKIALEQQLQGC